MAERVIGFRIEIKGTDAQVAALGKLQGQITTLTERQRRLNRIIKTVDQSTEQGRRRFDSLNKALASNTTQLKATRNRFNDLQATVLKSNDALRKNSGFVEGIKQAMRELQDEESRLIVKSKQVEKQFGRNSTQFKRVSRQLNSVTNNIRQTNNQLNVINRTTNNFGVSLKGLRNIFKQVGAVILAGFGIRALIGGIGNAIRTIREFDESLADLQKTTGLTKSSATELANVIRKFDTRTSVTELLALASAGGRLGLTGKDLIEFTRSVDMAFVSLGDSLDGTAEDIGLTLGKLAANFQLDKKFGVGEAISRVGSALNELGATTKAQEGPIIDFTQRLAGIAAQANIALPDVLALGALFDASGQSVEVAATTFAKLLPAIGRDIERFAGIAGVNIKEFKTIVEKDAFEALKLIAVGAKSNEEGLIGLTEVLENYGINNARAAGIVGVLTGNIDELTRIQAISNKAFSENTSLAAEFAIKNSTLSAEVEKTKKAYDNFILSIENGEGAIGGVIKSVLKLTQSILGAGTASSSATDELMSQSIALDAQSKEVTRLADRYDELQTQTELSSVEQEEQNKLITTIIGLVPSAAGEWDKYNKVIGINTSVLRENSKRQREVLRIEFKERIAEINVELSQQNIVLKRSEGTFDFYLKGLDAFGNKTEITKKGTALWNKVLLEQRIRIAQNEVQLSKLGVELTDTQKKTVDALLGTNQFTDSTEKAEDAAKEEAKALALLNAEASKATNTLNLLSKEQATLKKELGDVAIGSERFVEIGVRLKEITEEIAIATGKSTEATKKLAKAEKEAIKFQEKRLKIIEKTAKALRDIAKKQAFDEVDVQKEAVERFRVSRLDLFDIENERFEKELKAAGLKNLDELTATEDQKEALRAIEQLHNDNLLDIEDDKLEKAEERRKKNVEKKKKDDADELARRKIINDISFAAVQDFFGSLEGLFEKGTSEQKIFAIAQIAIDTARAISSLTAASEGNPLNAVTFGGAGLAQFVAGLARILSNISQAKKILTKAQYGMVLKAQEGMILSGASHANGGISIKLAGGGAIEAEGGEAIINTRSTSAFKPLLSAINSFGGFGRSFQGGGIPSVSPGGLGALIGQSSSEGSESLAEQVGEIINDIKVINVATETTDVAGQVINQQLEAQF